MVNMTQWHLHSKRKPSGGKNNSIYASKKKANQRGSDPTLTAIGEESKKIDKCFGKTKKIRLKKTKKAFVSDPKTNKTFEAIIESVKENKANRLFVRRNILTKGAIIKLKDGRYAVITSRPGQTGIVQAKLIEYKEEKNIGKQKTQKEKPKEEILEKIEQ